VKTAHFAGGRPATVASALDSGPVLACLATVIAVGSMYVSQPLLGELAAGFGVAPADARGAFGYPLLAYAAAFFLVGPLTDRLRAKHLILAGGGALAVLLAAAGFSRSLSAFTALMTLAGVAAAAVPAASFAVVPRLVPAERTGFWFGLLIAASVVGVTLGRALGGIAAASFGWRPSFVGAGILVALAAACFAAFTREADPPGAKLPLGSAYGDTLALLRGGPVLRYLAVGLLLFFGYLGLTTFLTLRLQGAPFDLSTAQIGWISFVGLAAVVGAPVSGLLTARVPAARVGAIGLAIVVVAQLVLLGASSTLAASLGLLGVFLGVFTCQPAVLVLLARVVPAARKGAGSSLYLLVCLACGGIASLVLGPLWLRYGWPGVVVPATGAVALALVLILLPTSHQQRS
jgi:YNFM family putative membrane transporter